MQTREKKINILMSLLFKMDESFTAVNNSSLAAIKPDQNSVELRNCYVIIAYGDFGVDAFATLPPPNCAECIESASQSKKNKNKYAA